MTHIKSRRDTSAIWAMDNPVLLAGEQGWETDTLKMKLGDGATQYNDLPYTFEIDLAALGLDLVDNTPDMSKPVSGPMNAALNDIIDMFSGLAPLASPGFTGNPTAPTPLTTDSDTSIATTAFVQAAIAAAGGIDVQRFTAGGTWAKPAGALKVVVEVQAGGAAGGGVAATGAGQNASGGGGGAGGYARRVLDASALAATVAAVVGAAGVAASGATGGSGGDSSFGTTSATGGIGGTSGAAFTPPGGSGGFGGAGGSGTGDFVIAGATGSSGFGLASARCACGAGGASHFGRSGGTAITTGQNLGSPATGYGAGGSGAANAQ